MLAFEAGWDFFLDAIAPVLRFDDRPIVRTFGSAPSAPASSGRSSRYSLRRSASSPTFPIASIT